MKLFFLALIATVSFSLEIGEKATFKILSIASENVLWINKGRIDHIVDREHVKIFYKGKFAARAINVRTNYQKSAWKLYRVVNPHLITKGNKLELKAIPIKDFAWEYLDKPLLHYRKIAVEFANKNIDLRKSDEDFLYKHKLDPKTLR